MLENISKSLPVSITTQALLLGVTVGALTYYTFFKKKYKLPPGPPALPLIGNLIDINKSTYVYQQLLDWRQKYGPIITIYFGPMRCITLNDANVVNEALVKKAGDYAGRLLLYSMSPFSGGFKDIVHADVSPAWKIQRKIALQGLRQYLSGSKLERRVFESSMKVLEAIREKNGQPFQLHQYISLLVFNILNGVCFNKIFAMDDEKFVHTLSLIDKINENFGMGYWEDVIPPLRLYPTAKYRRSVELVTSFDNFVKENLKEHMENIDDDDLQDLTDYMINARQKAIDDDPEVENIITETHVHKTLNDIFFAGIDTTRQTMTWTILLLIKHPEIQKKVQAELDKVLEAGQMPTVQDREKLPYTEAVIHETLRMRPITPLGVPHKTLCDTTIGGYDVPKGNVIIINQYALHHDPDWWEDPRQFKPERFLDENGAIAPKTLSWQPFSAGLRNCLGETIARPEMHLIIAFLLRNLTFSCPEGYQLDVKETGKMNMMPPIVDVIASPRN